jgi:glycosyltransferase involved in cell wall biosynthesis
LKKTSVLVVVASTERRGAEVEGTQLAAELATAGLDAHVVALCPGTAPALEIGTLGSAPLGLNTLRALRRRAREVDVVIAYGSSALPACAVAVAGCDVPFIYRSIGDPERWVRGRVHRWRTGVLFRRAAHVVALWPAAATTIASLYSVPSDRISCIANARPAAATVPMSKRAARAALGLPAFGTIVAWVGALSSEKRPELAVRVMAHLGDGYLAIAGDGPLKPVLADEAELLLEGRHRLLGVLDDLGPLWRAADAVLLTSRTEGMPGALIEAGLHGLPAAAVDVGAVSSVVIDHETGRVSPADADVVTLAAALADVVSHSQLLGDAAAAHAAAHFTWSTVAPEWVAVVARVGSQRHSTRSP